MESVHSTVKEVSSHFSEKQLKFQGNITLSSWTQISYIYLNSEPKFREHNRIVEFGSGKYLSYLFQAILLKTMKLRYIMKSITWP
jgi:hypothetical protein